MNLCDIIQKVIIMLNNFNWAILGCGNIANDFAREMNKMGGKVYSVANRTYEKAVAFEEKYNVLYSLTVGDITIFTFLQIV